MCMVADRDPFDRQRRPGYLRRTRCCGGVSWSHYRASAPDEYASYYGRWVSKITEENVLDLLEPRAETAAPTRRFPSRGGAGTHPGNGVSRM
jgi:hypothetical protein